MKLLSRTFLLLGGTLAGALPGWSQHAHINAGAIRLEQDAPLYFVNGASFVTNSGYVVTLVPDTTGTYSNQYQGSISFTALAATSYYGGPAFGHAAPGSHLELEVVSVDGPADSRLGFWETDEYTGLTSFRFSAPVGAREGTNRVVLSETDGAPGADPYGHVHGRAFSATRPGLHTVGFRILDTSMNGTGGGPIHRPSELFFLHFQAGVTVARVAAGGDTMSLTYGTRLGWTYHVEALTNQAAGGPWRAVAGPVAGDNRLRMSVVPVDSDGVNFYRLRVTGP
jgi:hypothetical protein